MADRVQVDVQGRGQFTHARKFVAGRKQPRSNLLLDGGSDLPVDGTWVVRVDGYEHGGLRDNCSITTITVLRPPVKKESRKDAVGPETRRATLTHVEWPYFGTPITSGREKKAVPLGDR